jgi:hypothetical protein
MKIRVRVRVRVRVRATLLHNNDVKNYDNNINNKNTFPSISIIIITIINNYFDNSNNINDINNTNNASTTLRFVRALPYPNLPCSENGVGAIPVDARVFAPLGAKHIWQ